MQRVLSLVQQLITYKYAHYFISMALIAAPFMAYEFWLLYRIRNPEVWLTFFVWGLIVLFLVERYIKR
jgi:hypothetical protein